ncbi:hypothetical protein F2Q68_00010418 [Brassica cretica]|uniref:Uncharacterized protein n=1 Tax=Brassica cretica TaxID=69181 RepID=A0A8S9KYH2_BRACR|nr:hypothetical protein F2Q68_00010418 [Brassica cretica]
MIIPLHRSILALICRPRPLPREREEDPIPLFAHSDNPRTAVSIEPTRFVDPDVNRQLGIREDLENMFVELEDPLELALVRAEAEQSVVNIDAAGYAKMLDSARKDPLELALVRAEAEQSVVNIDAVGYAKMLDSARSMGRMIARTKQSAKRTRATCTSSTLPPQAQQQTSATYPWPREQEGEPIDLDSPLLLDFNCEGWDKGTAARYNARLRVDMLPTRFCHAETLADLGIDEDVFEMLHAIGIAPLCYTTHELYPNLVRQVLATATITYEDSNAPS